MQYALMLYLDETITKKVDEYLEKLRDITNNDYMLNEKMPAHITLAMWNSDYDYINEIRSFVEKQNSFEIQFASIGIFGGEERHIFLSPVKNKAIMDIHRGLYEAINLEDERDYIETYKNEDIWVPHMTIGYQVKKDKMEEALKRCIDIKLPVKANAIKLAYAVCCPFTEVEVFDLK